MPQPRVIYLHGFASSPHSRKAQFFAEKLSGQGFSVDVPDLAQGDFTHLTLTGQLKIIETLLSTSPTPVALIGSSMGGYLAALAASRWPAQIARLVLLAPAFGFHALWTKESGPEKLQSWREKGTIPVFHYGENKELPLAFTLMEDAARFDAFPDARQPGLIFHGIGDPLVPIEQSRRFTAEHGNFRLLEFESGHELTDVLDEMWRASSQFLLAGEL